MGFSIRDRLYSSDFEDEARSSNNQEAIRLIEWYENEWTRLSKDDIVRAFVDSMDIEVHRGTKPLQTYHDIRIDSQNHKTRPDFCLTYKT